MAFEPVVKSRFAAAEAVELVVLAERLRRAIGHALFGAQDARLGKQLAQAGIILRWAVEQLDEPIPFLAGEDEARAVGQKPLGLKHGGVDDEVRQGSVRGIGSLADEPIGI